MTWIECREEGCGLDAEPGRKWSMDGVGYDGKAIRVWYEERLCAGGHRHQVEIYEEDIYADGQ